MPGALRTDRYARLTSILGVIAFRHGSQGTDYGFLTRKSCGDRTLIHRVALNDAYSGSSFKQSPRITHIRSDCVTRIESGRDDEATGRACGPEDKEIHVCLMQLLRGSTLGAVKPNAPADRRAASGGTANEAALSRSSTLPDLSEAASRLCGRAGSQRAASRKARNTALIRV